MVFNRLWRNKDEDWKLEIEIGDEDLYLYLQSLLSKRLKKKSTKGLV